MASGQSHRHVIGARRVLLRPYATGCTAGAGDADASTRHALSPGFCRGGAEASAMWGGETHGFAPLGPVVAAWGSSFASAEWSNDEQASIVRHFSPSEYVPDDLVRYR